MADKDIDYQALLDAEIAKDDYRKNYSLSAETRAKLSEASKRRWQDPKYRELMEGRTGQGEGGSLTKEMREKISQAKKGKPAHNKGKGKRIMTPNGEFPSLTAVSKAAGVVPSTVYEWMQKYPKDYYYIKN